MKQVGVSGAITEKAYQSYIQPNTSEPEQSEEEARLRQTVWYDFYQELGIEGPNRRAMKTKIAAIVGASIALIVVAFVTRYHYEHGPNDALFRINLYTGETCRLSLVTVQPKANSNPLDALEPKTNSNPFDSLDSHPSASSYNWTTCGK